MAMGPMTLACALLLANAGAPDTWHMSQGRFQIPIKIAPERRNDIRELLLYVSKDQGKTWAVESRATPDKQAFPYYAAGDGAYWFSVAIIDQQGRQDPVDIYQSPVGQRIYVDTRKPEIRLVRAERSGDEVQVQWEIREDNPDPATFKLEYRAADQPGGLWTQISAPGGLQGQASFRVTGLGAVQVRVLLNDLAGNIGLALADVAGSTPAPAPPALGGPGLSVVPPPEQASGEVPPPLSVGPNGVPIGTYNNTVPPMESTSRIPGRPAEESTRPLPTQLIPNVQGNAPIAQASLGQREPGAAVGTFPSPLPAMRGAMSAVEIINKKQAKLDFQVGKYGPSGLGSVEVYVTTDDGATWTLTPTDRNVQLPSPAEVRGGAPVMGSVLVDLPKEGVVHGFYIVVKSRAGLGKEPPRAGTPPMLRVEMDTTPPAAALYEPKADPSRRDTLLLGWEATDKNLAANPITLEWSERKDGRWNPIGPSELPNTGKYSWQVPADAPPSVYLRLTVRDVAGNTAVAQTGEPVLVDLSVPEVGGISLSRGK